MRFSLATVTGVVLAGVPALVRAQDPNQAFMVNVGANNQLVFDPSTITAPVGANITFMFTSKNHTVYQSSFADPCNRIDNGFAADYFPIQAGETTFPTVTIQVTSSNPVWVYCAQTNPVNHCKMGMVAAINPTPDKTFDQFRAIAMGQQPPPAANGGSSTSSSTGGAPTSGAPTSGAPAPGAPGSAPPTSGGGPITAGTGTSTGALPNSSGTTTNANQPANTAGALPQMKGAFTAIAIGLLGVVAFLL